MAAEDAARAVGLGATPLRLLVYAAHRVLDPPGRPEGPHGRYFAGRQDLAIGLGYGAAGKPAIDSTAAQKAVAWAVTECKNAGLLIVAQRAHNFRNAVYDLSPLLEYAVRAPSKVQMRASDRGG